MELIGEPDGLERLWTPHRFGYIVGDDRPATPSEDECPFCEIPKRTDADGLIVYRGETCFVVLNLYPYNAGHLLICTYRHVADYPELSAEETSEMTKLTQEAMRVLRKVSSPHGFNLGMNQGSEAGAGIAGHIHQHVVPRWGGDSNFMPLIAKTKVLPQLLSDTRELIADAWNK